jgi:predicted HTH domain antitoxin
MPVVIPDEFLQQVGMTERELLIEIACRLFDAEKIYLPDAGRLAGLTRTEMEEELIKRNLPIVRYTEEMLRQDLEAIRFLEAERARHNQ